jgi:hypothetical protein
MLQVGKFYYRTYLCEKEQVGITEYVSVKSRIKDGPFTGATVRHKPNSLTLSYEEIIEDRDDYQLIDKAGFIEALGFVIDSVKRSL